jgi:hypothetical protein
MIVSDTEKFIFIHNPKCAGMAIRSCIQQYDTSNNFFSGCKTINDQKLGMAHLPLWKLNERFPEFIDSRIRKYYTFTTVRNPYTRTVAAFNMICESEYIRFKEEGNLNEYRERLNSFIETIDTDKINAFDYDYRHFTRQAEYVYFGNEKLIDSVLFFEKLPEHFIRISWMNTLLYHRITTNLKSLNVRFVTENTIDLLSRRSKDMINRIYEKDFEKFEYSIL